MVSHDDFVCRSDLDLTWQQRDGLDLDEEIIALPL
jgi:hypothetical protein